MIDRDAQSLVEAARQRLKLFDIMRHRSGGSRRAKGRSARSPSIALTAATCCRRTSTRARASWPAPTCFDVADLSTVWITADIYEFEMPLIKVGDEAAVQLSYFPGRQFNTRIDYIYPTLQGETRTLKARFTLPNEGGRLKPQMFTNVETEDKPREEAGSSLRRGY